MWRGRGGGFDTGQNSRTKPCFHFQRGQCRFGTNCNFLHDTSPTTDNSMAMPPVPLATANPRRKYMTWKVMVRKPPLGFQTTSGAKEYHKFWTRALEILDDDDVEQHQDVARDLANDNLHGQRFIVDTAENGSSNARESLPTSYVLLQIITHKNLMDSLSIEVSVATIFRSFAGASGERGLALLSAMCEQALESSELFSELLGATIQTVLLVMVTTLQQLLNREPRAQFSDELPDLLEQVDKLIATVTEDVSPKELHDLSTRFKLLKRGVTAARDRLAAAENSSDNLRDFRSIASIFPKDMEIPGGRHDNDFADINKIAILPTRDEITSDHQEYLPSTNFTEPHVLDEPLQRHVDSMFRLVRHDILGPVKDILRDLLQSEDLLSGRLSNPDPQAQVYLQSSIKTLSSSKKFGTEAVISFQPPYNMLNKTPAQQKTWWKASPRLGQGTLVCFVSPTPGHISLLFLQVTSKRTDHEPRDDNDDGRSNVTPLQGLPSVTVKLANHNRDDLCLLAKLYTTNATGVLVDFNGVILDTFVPILNNLKRIKREEQIAFQQWILPCPAEDQSVTTPVYARTLDFDFSLRAITKDKAVDLALDPENPEGLDIRELEEATGLDQGQCHGLVGALTREYALIQGPPGTGKSYLGVQILRVLLAAKQKAHLGPIVIVCYTNHALDQFLKHLLDVGISRIIRIGGRSVAPELAGLNLRVVSQDTAKTYAERSTLSIAFRQIESNTCIASEATESLSHARKRFTWPFLSGFLAVEYPRIHEQFETNANDGYTLHGGDPLEVWIGSQTQENSADTPNPDLNSMEMKAEKDIHSLATWERRALLNDWVRRHEEEQTDVLFEAMDEYEEQQKNIKRTHDGANQRTLQQAEVIGLTTTSLAGRIDLLRSVKPKVLICEEAGEVKEADIISTLMPSLEHCIQIGDHQQLRPQINNFDLSLESSSGQKWKLDRSQFERRAEGEPGLDPSPFTQLNIQRRMRPEVSQLIRGVYPNLVDHESVLNTPDVVGMLDNVFWLDHSHPQDVGGDGTRVKSHSNRWETNMATALVRHLVRQGEYRAEDIALLTPYTGQLQQLRTALSSDFEICLGDRDREQLSHEEFIDDASSKKPIEKKKLLKTIRLATVDNFQGEEAKIIIVSLVRSNAERQVGFLRTENRINVLLSRAKHGMYLIGNAATYLNVPMWADVYEILEKSNAVGTELKLCCPRHPETPIACSEPEHFAIRSPEGGCALPCSRRLEPCGHKCQATCHSEAMHEAFACARPCPRIRTTCNHPCPKLCGERCGPCLVDVHDVELPCGHIVETMACDQAQNPETFKCTAAVERIHPHCGHVVTIKCHEIGNTELARVARAVLTPSVSNDAIALSAPAIIDVCSHAIPERTVAPARNLVNKKKADRVDLLEFRSYAAIDLDESPIVVLGCGHFFTSETLDGLVGLDEVYLKDGFGNFTGLKNISGSLAQTTPCCPDCKRTIRQFATKRYNRVINRAVMDDICKRFLIKGQTALEKLNHKLAKVEAALAASRRSTSMALHHTATTFFRERHSGIKTLENSAIYLQQVIGEENQPAKKLINAIATSRPAVADGSSSITQLMEALKLSRSAPDDQLLLGARLAILEAQQIQLMDAFMVSKSQEKNVHKNALDLPVTDKWFKTCQELMEEAKEAKLPRIFIAATLAFAKIARAATWSAKSERNPSGAQESDHIETARTLLSTASFFCLSLGDSDVLTKRLEDMMELYEPRVEEVTPEELASIRSAMVTGPHGMATHSGHWYNCVNGHPFAIGECGMPMETARCPECGAAIGGANHRIVNGVSRAENMETPAEEVRREGENADQPVGRRVGEPIGAFGGQPVEEGCVVM
ncbi:nfx1-type zinc finger-containing protein 1 [Fusarium flagelliforme]|uniref:Nfx1-type zinc finger-containing protein 1 n=1 Tax=Fusarium flagelliforme TaxID=2675880 RepID=A0A395N135_9HYPO|nr:nfx1-type zinc finger-containing protein 1 [Fusarium flagelliforme]